MIVDARDLARVRNPMLLITAAAWVLLLVGPGSSSSGSLPMLSHHHHAASLPMLLAMTSPTSLAASWLLMLVAMMTPALIPPIRHLYARSFRRRRARAIALFVAAYAAIWLAAGTVLIALALTLTMLPAITAAAVAIVAACAWQCSPMKQRCLNRCHVHREIAAFGTAADLAAVRFGTTHGLWCAGACWLLMLMPLLVPHAHTIAMAAVTLIIVSERLERPSPPRWRVRLPGKAIRIAIAQTRIRLQFHTA
jgi:predicted metal-binding membrane protein